MTLTTETLLRKQNAFIVTKHNHHFITLLKNQLKKFDVNVFVSAHAPTDTSTYSFFFIINEAGSILTECLRYPHKKFIFILFNKDQLAQGIHTFAKDKHLSNIKVINLETSPHFFQDDIDTILWFAFSRGDEIFLQIYHPKVAASTPARPKSQPKNKRDFKSYLTPKKLILLGFSIIFFSHILFIPPLLLTTWFNVQAGKAMLNKDMEKSQTNAHYASNGLDLTKSLYKFSRPTLLFFSIAQLPDDLLQLNISAQEIITSSTQLQKKGTVFLTTLVQKDKSSYEIEQLSLQKDAIIHDFQILHQNISIIQAKLPTWTPELVELKQKLNETSQTFDAIEKFLPFLDSIFAKGTTKKYVLLFANNMEIRPGGGFIGSFGLVTMKDYTMEELKIYDVYDADGQLTAHVEPPKPISQYLNQTHWFLRDSAFSPDFYENYEQARFFLDKEIQETNIDGGILLTTTTVQNLIESIGSLYVPDFKETVTKDNFYLKAQLYAEKEFFPGSIQKKKFLSSVMNQMMIDLEKAPPNKLFSMLQKSLDEKQMVIYMNDPKLQDAVNDLYWAGRTIKPKCSRPDVANCVVDYLFPYDANLGVNKANFFVSRPVNLNINITKNGNVTNELTMQYKNDSYEDVFPGGTYKNYLQILLPPTATVQEVTIDNVKVEQFDEKVETFKTIGFLTEVPPQSTKSVKVKYQLAAPLQNGQGIYQLIFQKQVGARSSDLELKITVPPNVYVVNKNFSPLVKGNQIIYNTTITSDKIFIVEFYKE